MENAKSGGMGLASWLTLIFVVAKILGYITWSWWVVFAPVWITLLVVLVILGCVFAGYVWLNI